MGALSSRCPLAPSHSQGITGQQSGGGRCCQETGVCGAPEGSGELQGEVMLSGPSNDVDESKQVGHSVNKLNEKPRIKNWRNRNQN